MSARRILVVEDDPQNLALVRDLLTYHGYVALEAETAEDGVEVARAEGPDLVLMDIHLPGMDGLAALRALRADPAIRAMPVIAVTASVLEEEQRQLLQAGFDAVHNKPLDIDALVDDVRRLLGEPSRRVR